MKIVHLSDTHLGFSSGSRLDRETGLNVREADMQAAFRRAIDVILEVAPHAVLHAGDFFDAHHPSNRTLSFAMRQLRRLGDAGIPLVVLAGNTSTPRHGGGSVFEVLELLPQVHPIYGRTQRVSLGPLTVHGVPHHPDAARMTHELAALQADPGAAFNVVMTHLFVRDVAQRGHESNAVMVDDVSLEHRGVDYYALGDSHRYAQLQDNAFYCGAPEHLSVAEADGTPRGLLEVDLDRRGSPGWVRFHRLATRPMRDVPVPSFFGLSATEAMTALEHTIAGFSAPGAMLHVALDMAPEVYRQLDLAGLRERHPELLELTVQLASSEPESEALPLVSGGVYDDFARYVLEQGFGEDVDTRWLIDEGRRVLRDLEQDRALEVAP